MIGGVCIILDGLCTFAKQGFYATYKLFVVSIAVYGLLSDSY